MAATTTAAQKTGTFGNLVYGERIHVSEVDESFMAMVPGGDELLLLKRLKDVGDSTARQRFTSVAEVANRFDHPALCRVIDHGRDFMVRQFAEGKDLRALIRRLVLQQEQVDEPLALYVASQVCVAMEHVHGRVTATDRVTGDVSARHVVLTYDGEVFLTEPITAGEAMDPALDVARIGEMLHEMLTGQLPDEANGVQLDPRVRPLVQEGHRSGLAGLRHAIQQRLEQLATPVSASDVAELVNRVFIRARRSELKWRRQLSSAELEPQAPPAPEPEVAEQSTEAPATVRSSLRLVFIMLVGLALALLVYRGVVALRAPYGLVSVRSDVPVKVVIDGELRRTAPVSRIKLSPGKHRLSFRFGSGRVMKKVIKLDEKQHIELRLREERR